jgi:hypothetical protein
MPLLREELRFAKKRRSRGDEDRYRWHRKHCYAARNERLRDMRPTTVQGWIEEYKAQGRRSPEVDLLSAIPATQAGEPLLRLIFRSAHSPTAVNTTPRASRHIAATNQAACSNKIPSAASNDIATPRTVRLDGRMSAGPNSALGRIAIPLSV